jgi:uncharacterized protein (DUF1501 family)
MKVTRREFVRGGVTAFTVSFAAPAFLSDLARAQGASRRNLVVLYLNGGNDALSTLIPYTDSFYYSRRPTQGILAGSVIQIGTDSAGNQLGLHPRLTGLKQIWDQGDLAIIQRTGYQNSSRSHFQGTDIWSTANTQNYTGTGWLGRYLDTLPSPVDPLAGWATTREVPRMLMGNRVSVPAIQTPSTYAFQGPNAGQELTYSRTAMSQLASHLPPDKPQVSFVNGTMQAALNTLDKVATVAAYQPSVQYGNDGLSQAFRAVAGAIRNQLGTKVFWVTTGGYDTHANQNANSANAGYSNLMGVLNNGVTTFYNDLRNQGLLQDTLIVQFSEFGRRISENGSTGTDHGAGGLMMAIGGAVDGQRLFGTAANLAPGHPTLENNSGDVRYETDFRSVYARILDNWLGVDSVPILSGNFRNPALTFI